MSAELAQLQRAFLAAMRGDDAQPALRLLTPARRGALDVGLSIYRNAYASRFQEALENDHPALGVYLGDELWARLCTGYIAAHPSTVRSLRNFGDSVPAYLRSEEPFRASPQIAELAELERRLLDCFDAADAEPAPWSALLSTPEAAWPGLRLRFHSSVRQHRVAWNSVEIWKSLKAGQVPPDAAAVVGRWLLWRDQDRISRFRSLDEAESAALVHCLAGGDFAGLCECLSCWQPAEQVPAAAVGLLKRWSGEGLISHWQHGTSAAGTAFHCATTAHPFLPSASL